MDHDHVGTARLALACLDLTSLNDGDTPADIATLCARAVGADPARGQAGEPPARGQSNDRPARGQPIERPARGPVGAVCVWPRFVAQARAALPAHIAVAAVANFPAGGSDLQRAVADTHAIVQAGGQEVDVVMPYRDLAAAPALLAAVRRACDGLLLKVILETGELPDAASMLRASRIALDAGADFLKTSTGKTPQSATPDAARVLLGAIAADPAARGRVGFKASGGIRTVADAALYIGLTRELLGTGALTPGRFRIGASSLLNDIDAVLAPGAAPALPPADGRY